MFEYNPNISHWKIYSKASAVLNLQGLTLNLSKDFQQNNFP